MKVLDERDGDRPGQRQQIARPRHGRGRGAPSADHRGSPRRGRSIAATVPTVATGRIERTDQTGQAAFARSIDGGAAHKKNTPRQVQGESHYPLRFLYKAEWRRVLKWPVRKNKHQPADGLSRKN